MTELKQVFVVDGRQFDSKAEAKAYLSRPKIVAALRTFIGTGEKQDNIINWLVENQEAVEVAFEAGTIKRVTKSEFNQLAKALEALSAFAAENSEINKKCGFIITNAEAVNSSFRWPSVKRMSDEEKAAEALKQLTDASESEALATFIVENKDQILEAYGAAKEKRTVSPNATNALAAYRAEKAAKKAAAEAAKVVGEGAAE